MFKVLAIIAMMLPLTACREEQRSLPIIHAATSTTRAVRQNRFQPVVHGRRHHRRIGTRQSAHPIDDKVPPQYCYSFIPKRPRDQRANAVQARLEQADRMTAAFDPDLLSVDLIGDHANILALEFPTAWPAQSYVSQVSSVVEEYFASADIEDYICNTGFAEVRLSARSLTDQRLHPIWTARVTSEGLLKSSAP